MEKRERDYSEQTNELKIAEDEIDELKKAVRATLKLNSTELPDFEIESLFDMLDADHSETIEIDEFLAPTTEMRLRFEASDLGDGSLVEAGVDLLVYGGVECEDGDVCIADLNGDGIVNAADLGSLIGNWGCKGPDCVADVNQDGIVNSADLGLVIGAWNQDC